MASNLCQSGKKNDKQEVVGKKYFLAEKDCKSSYPLHLKGILGVCEQMLTRIRVCVQEIFAVIPHATHFRISSENLCSKNTTFAKNKYNERHYGLCKTFLLDTLLHSLYCYELCSMFL